MLFRSISNFTFSHALENSVEKTEEKKGTSIFSYIAAGAGAIASAIGLYALYALIFGEKSDSSQNSPNEKPKTSEKDEIRQIVGDEEYSQQAALLERIEQQRKQQEEERRRQQEQQQILEKQRKQKLNKKLINAVLKNNSSKVDKCLKEGADINYAESQCGYTPLMCAIIKENCEIAKVLINAGADLNVKDDNGQDRKSVV